MCPIRRWRSSPAGRRPSPTPPIPSSRYQPKYFRVWSSTSPAVPYGQHPIPFRVSPRHTHSNSHFMPHIRIHRPHRPNINLKYIFFHSHIHTLKFSVLTEFTGFPADLPPPTHPPHISKHADRIFARVCAKPFNCTVSRIGRDQQATIPCWLPALISSFVSFLFRILFHLFFFKFQE